MTNETIHKLQQLVKDSYRAIAVDFDVSRKKEIWPEVHYLAQSIQSSASVLDVGCGNGRILEVFANKSINYLGIDNSLELITLAQKNYPQFTFRVMDILDLSPLSDDHYDFIFCLAVILHLPSHNSRLRALENLAAKLKPGGQLIISVWDLYGYKKFRSLFRKATWNKFLGRSDLDYGDLIFPWKNSQGVVVSDRYYHAFKRRELIRLVAEAKLKLQHLYRRRGNYWLIISR